MQSRISQEDISETHLHKGALAMGFLGVARVFAQYYPAQLQHLQSSISDERKKNSLSFVAVSC